MNHLFALIPTTHDNVVRDLQNVRPNARFFEEFARVNRLESLSLLSRFVAADSDEIVCEHAPRIPAQFVIDSNGREITGNIVPFVDDKEVISYTDAVRRRRQRQLKEV